MRDLCMDWSVSIRGTFKALRFYTFTFHHKARPAVVERRIKEICEARMCNRSRTAK